MSSADSSRLRGLQYFPFEILSQIVSYLTTYPDLVSARLTCRAFHLAIPKRLDTYRRTFLLSLEEQSKIDDLGRSMRASLSCCKRILPTHKFPDSGRKGRRCTDCEKRRTDRRKLISIQLWPCTLCPGCDRWTVTSDPRIRRWRYPRHPKFKAGLPFLTEYDWPERSSYSFPGALSLLTDHVPETCQIPEYLWHTLGCQAAERCRYCGDQMKWSRCTQLKSGCRERCDCHIHCPAKGCDIVDGYEKHPELGGFKRHVHYSQDCGGQLMRFVAPAITDGKVPAYIPYIEPGEFEYELRGFTILGGGIQYRVVILSLLAVYETEMHDRAKKYRPLDNKFVEYIYGCPAEAVKKYPGFDPRDHTNVRQRCLYAAQFRAMRAEVDFILSGEYTCRQVYDLWLGKSWPTNIPPEKLDLGILRMDEDQYDRSVEFWAADEPLSMGKGGECVTKSGGYPVWKLVNRTKGGGFAPGVQPLFRS